MYVPVRLHWGGQASAARLGLYLLIEVVTVCGRFTPVILRGVISPEESFCACSALESVERCVEMMSAKINHANCFVRNGWSKWLTKRCKAGGCAAVMGDAAILSHTEWFKNRFAEVSFPTNLSNCLLLLLI